MRSCPRETLGAGRSEQRSASTAGNPALLQSSGDAQDFGVSHTLLGPLVRLSRGDRWRQGSPGCRLTRDAAAQPASLGPAAQLMTGSALHEARRFSKRCSYATSSRSPAPQAW